MFLANTWEDYEVLDTGDGEKLERWGNVILRRPDPQTIWPKADPALWKQAQAHYHRSEKGGGEWEFLTRLPERWTIQHQDLRFYVRPTGFKHTGLFPEQAANWVWMGDLIRNSGRKDIRVLNLFGYTGGATLACMAAGAHVTHVDAAKGMIQWGKENRELSKLPEERSRWIVEDALRFVQREIRRGNTYDGILMDPPSYGRGRGVEAGKRAVRAGRYEREGAVRQAAVLPHQQLHDGLSGQRPQQYADEVRQQPPWGHHRRAGTLPAGDDGRRAALRRKRKVVGQMNEFPLHQLANIDVQYEDNHVIVAVKPPNMLSQADKTGDTDILTQIKEYIKIKYNKPGAVYLGLVHRLDRPVGGLMVFARTSKAASRLSAQMREHEMGREYLCVVEGRVKDRFTCIDYLKKNEYLNKVEICDADEKGAQLAMLSGECLARKNGTALCAIRLQTGRNHQIRVQMANMGAPLWGDNKYGRGIAGQQIALWGYRLVFEHPTRKEIMTFQNLPCGSIWNCYAEELTDMAIRFNNSAEAILNPDIPDNGGIEP